MATELAKAYVQIIPSAKGIKGSISSLLGEEADSAGKSAGKSGGNIFIKTFKTVIAAAGLGKALGASLLEGADLQQSIGGIETLFKDSADTVKTYAANAYQTAGLSANQYMETVTGFSASLLQSMGNDTAAAAEKANMALTDMSDNANKMGSDMQDIQNAYQGFAKQNYTMLDNLKLGYGGTKEEMERLLADAQAISGVEYDVSSYADVVDAIHVIQTEMGITGTTAKEASETFSGSMAAMKAAAKNLIGNLSLGEDIGPSLSALQETTYTFLMGNFFPMVGNIISQLPQVIGTAMSTAVRAINIAANNAEDIVRMGVELVAGIAGAVVGAAPYLLEAAINLIAAFGQAILDTDWAGVASDLAADIRDALNQASGEIFGSDDSIITAVGDSITNNLPALLGKGVEIITNLANGILDAIPDLITTAGTMVQQFAGFVADNLPTVISAGAELASNLGQAIEDALPGIFSALGETVSNLTGGLVPEDAFTQILDAMGGLRDAFSPVVDKITELRDKFTESVDGGAIFTTVISGVSEVITTLIGGFTTAIDLVTSFVTWMTSGSAGASAFQAVLVGITAAFGAYQIATTAVTVAQGVLHGATTLLTTAQTLLNAVMVANPLGLVAIAITGLVAAVLYLWNTNEGFRNAVTSAWETIKSTAETVWNAVAVFFTETIPNAIDSALEYFDNLMNGSTEDMNAIELVVSTVLNNISTIFNTVLAAIKGAVSAFLSVLKGDWSGALDTLKSTASTVWEGIKTVFSNKLSLIKTAVSTALDAVKGFFSDKLSAAKDTVSSIFDSIKTAISDKITAAKNTVSSVIDAIKSKFNFSWSLPKLKLPHLSIRGSFSLTPPSVPKFSISWYKRAMNNAMLLNGATIFGMAGNTFLGGGEAGPEVVSGADTLMTMIRSAVEGASKPASGQGEATVYMNINVAAAPGMSEKELVDRMIDKVTIEIRKAGYRLCVTQ